MSFMRLAYGTFCCDWPISICTFLLWSARIHEEWIHNLLKNRPDLPVEKLRRTQAEMDEHFPAAVVTGYESLIKEISLPDSGDHHVLAAAAHGKADIIVTLNLQDFPSTQLARYALSARHPDTFIAGLFDAWPQEFLLAIREHRIALKNPAKSSERYGASLADIGLVQTALMLQNYESII